MFHILRWCDYFVFGCLSLELCSTRLWINFVFLVPSLITVIISLGNRAIAIIADCRSPLMFIDRYVNICWTLSEKYFVMNTDAMGMLTFRVQIFHQHRTLLTYKSIGLLCLLYFEMKVMLALKKRHHSANKLRQAFD